MTDTQRPATWWTGSMTVVTVLVAAACAGVLYSYVPPVVYSSYFALAAFVLAAFGLLWLLLAVVGWSKYRNVRRTAVAPVLVVLTALLMALSIPPKVAFAISEDTMNASAKPCKDVREEERIALYNVWKTRAVGTGCFFYIRGGGAIDSIGLAFLPDGPPDVPDPVYNNPVYNNPDFNNFFEYDEFDGDWYRFTEYLKPSR